MMGTTCHQAGASTFPIFNVSHNLIKLNPRHLWTSKSRFRTPLARGKRLQQLRELHRWTDEELKWAIEILGEPTAYSLHWRGFMPTLIEQGTPKQHELSLRRAEKMEIIGSYAQTELGHGSNIHGIETTAIWDPTDKTFTLHTPHITSAEWWVGTSGLSANYALVMARLILSGKDYGPHPFMCQVRDLVSHETLDGAYVGYIGPKVEYKFSCVDPERNVHVPPESPALVYGTMTMFRGALVAESSRILARSLTIATRYCAVRCQFHNQDSGADPTRETQVLDYTMVQYRPFPLLGEALALSFTGQSMTEFYHETEAALNNPHSESDSCNVKELFAELHATSCGLKGLATSTDVQGIEVYRRSCGSHGFSSFAGLGSVYTDFLPSQTCEGDNFVLGQQTAYYLLKSARYVIQGDVPANITTANLTKYLAGKGKACHFDLGELMGVLGWRVAHLTFETLKRANVPSQSRNRLLVDFWRLSTAHSQFLVVRGFYEHLKRLETQPRQLLDVQTRQVLWKLYRLYALTVLVSAAHKLYASSALQVADIERANNETIMQLLSDSRPHAVRLVEIYINVKPQQPNVNV